MANGIQGVTERTLGRTFQFPSIGTNIFQPRNDFVSRMFGVGTGAPGVGAGGALAAFGGPVGLGLGLGSQLLSFLGGAGERRRKKELRGALAGDIAGFQQQMGTPVLGNIGDIIGRTQAAMQPTIQRQGRRFEEQFGLDVGRGQGAFAQQLGQRLPEIFVNLQQRESELRAQRDQQLRNLILQARSQQAQLG